MFARGVLSGLLGLLFLGCTEAAPEAPAKAPEAPPPAPMTLRLDDERPLLFTWRDPETGRFVSAEALEDIPPAARSAVVVTDLSASPEARRAARYVQVADLDQRNPDGTVAVSVASRYGFDTLPTSAGGEAVSDAKEVIMYSASWCGVCKKAKRLMTQWGVPFVVKDIEASRAAMEELGAKSAKAGLRPGGVPVIDVGGTLLQGLDESRLRAELQRIGVLAGG